MTGRWRRTAAGLAALVAVTVAAATVAESAVAAPWCGTTTTEDRPPAVAGRSIRVVYAYPSDGLDRSAQLAPRISSDIDEIDAWWRGQDTLREPRFDRAAFSCGPQADVLVVKLTDGAARLRASDRYERITDTVLLATGRSQYGKELVYYDGPVDDVDACGEGAGRADGEGAGIVYLGACSDVPSAAVAAHELLHALGALEGSGPPHACPDTRGHPCDSTLDLLYPYASAIPLGSLALDVGHDDYYGHSGSWPDVQDSRWLRLVTQQLSLGLAITGKGSVESDIPGLDCAASCVTEWDAGSTVSLEALPADGQRFVRWSGSCTGSVRCAVSLRAAASVGALFAPARFGVVLSVSGRGAVSGAGTPCRMTRCLRTATSYTPLRLRAMPAAGWRLAGWSGACAGRASTCTVPVTKASAVRARFVRR